MWNGTAETLKAIPAQRNTSPKTSPVPRCSAPPAAAMPANPVVPAKP